MNEYGWIKPGVQAKLVTCITHPELNGTIVTVKQAPRSVSNPYTNRTWLGVMVEEGTTLVRGSHVVPRADHLEPYPKPNYPDWEQIATCKTIRQPSKEEVQ